MADGTTVQSASYPTVEYDITTVAGQNNTVGSNIYLPILDTVNKLCVTSTTGGTLTLPQVPGFALTVAPGSATFPGGSKTGCVSVTPVNSDKVPMTPGFGQQPRFIVTIQPVGTLFSPPAALALPNVDGLKPRQVTEMYSYDHDLSAFVAIGTATVSDDGLVVKSDPGVGVLKAGWHCGGDSAPTGSAGDCGVCGMCNGSSCTPVPDGTASTQTYSLGGIDTTINQLRQFFQFVGLGGTIVLPTFSGQVEQTTIPHCCENDPLTGRKTSVTGSLNMTYSLPKFRPAFPPWTGNYEATIFGQTYGVAYGIEIAVAASAAVQIAADAECQGPTTWSGGVQGSISLNANIFGEIPNPAIRDECGPSKQDPCNLLSLTGGDGTGLTLASTVSANKIVIDQLQWSGLSIGFQIELFEGTLLDYSFSNRLTVYGQTTIGTAVEIPLSSLQ